MVFWNRIKTQIVATQGIGNNNQNDFQKSKTQLARTFIHRAEKGLHSPASRPRLADEEKSCVFEWLFLKKSPYSDSSILTNAEGGVTYHF